MPVKDRTLIQRLGWNAQNECWEGHRIRDQQNNHARLPWKGQNVREHISSRLLGHDTFPRIHGGIRPSLMDALQEARVRLQEHVARCQVCHRRVKLHGSIPSTLQTVTGQAILLIELLASRQISLIRGEAGCGRHETISRRQHTQDIEAGALHGFLFPPDPVSTL